MQHLELHGEIRSPGSIKSTYEKHGSFVYRGLFSPAEVETLQQISKLVFGIADAIAAEVPADRIPEDIRGGLVHGYISWGTITSWLERTTTEFTLRLAAIVKKSQAIAVSAYSDPDPQFLDGFALVRRHLKVPRPGQATTVPWHRDATFITLAGVKQSINIWVPLVEVGKSAPSLEIMVESQQYMRTVADETPGITQISQEWIATHLSTFAHWAPHCVPGDAVVFDHHTVHRTQQLSEPANIDRMSFEFRWAPSIAYA